MRGRTLPSARATLAGAMSPRRFVFAVLAALALAFLAARTFRGRAEWSPPAAPSEPGTLSP